MEDKLRDRLNALHRKYGVYLEDVPALFVKDGKDDLRLMSFKEADEWAEDENRVKLYFQLTERKNTLNKLDKKLKAINALEKPMRKND